MTPSSNGTAMPVHSTGLERSLGGLVMLVGAGVLVGWAFDITPLKQVLSGAIGMKANTAVAFVLCGLAVTTSAGASAQWRVRIVLLLSIAVALLGTLSLGEELFSVNLGIDEFLFPDPGSVNRISRAGRMSPATAFCFMSIAAALASYVLPQRARLQMPLAAALSASVVVISSMILAGHVSHQALGLRWGAASSMAIHTAVMFQVLGMEVLLRARRMQSGTWALGRASTTGFVIGIVLMLGAAEVSSSFAQDMEATTAKVVRTQQTLQELQEIRTDMRAMEGAQRGHLVLGDESFLQSRDAIKASVLGHLSNLRNTHLADALLPGQIQTLSSAIENRIAFGDQLIVTRRTQGFEAARAVFNTGEDVALTARITNAIVPMAKLERDLLAQRQQHLKEATATTFLLLPIGSFLGLAALLSGLFFLDHGFEKRLRAEQALSRSRAQIRVAFDNMSEGIRVIDPNLDIIQMNPAGATMHGLIEPATSLRSIMAQVDAVSSSGRVMAPEEWPAERALRGEFVRNLEVKFRVKESGRSVVTEINTAPLPVEPGERVHVIVTSHDVTERKVAEAAIRDSQERLERVVENLSEGVLIHGLTGPMVHWNRAALCMYELTAEAAHSMTREDFQGLLEMQTLEGEVVPFEQWPMSRLMRGEELSRTEVRVRRIDRPWERVFSYEGAQIREISGSPLLFLTVTDVTARKIAELQLQQLNSELERRVALRTSELQAKSKELESFCYSVSHDLKAPLRGIDGYSRLLFDEYGDKLDADGRAFIGNVRKATTQMNGLIEDLLAYSQLERRTLVPAHVRLRAFVDEKLARRAADLASVQLSVAVEDVVVLADREGIAMALRNLIDNAVKFSSRSKPPTISIRSRTVGSRCVLSVQDNGTGFDMRYYDKIFEIFQRLHLAEDYPGTGVGLALVRKAMERMGGRVWAESRLGEGATFHLEFEMATSQASEPVA